MLCAKCEYDRDVIINKCLGFCGLKSYLIMDPSITL